jgi:hypothetical protein
MDGNVKTGLRETIEGFEVITWWTSNGLTLHTQVTVAGGIFTGTTMWSTHDEAVANGETAKVLTVRAVVEKIQAGTLQVGTNNKVKRVQTKHRDIFLTWWWPHADIRTPRWRGKGEWVFMVGWFRRAFVLSIRKKKS